MLYREHKVIFLNVLAEKREYYWHCDPECRPLTDGDMCNTLLPVIKTTTDWTPLTNRLRAWDPCTPWIPWSVKECSSGFKWVVLGGRLAPDISLSPSCCHKLAWQPSFHFFSVWFYFLACGLLLTWQQTEKKKYKRQQKASLGTPCMTSFRCKLFYWHFALKACVPFSFFSRGLNSQWRVHNVLQASKLELKILFKC